MRILLLSDTHGFLDARIAACAKDCALAVHAGDIGSSAVLTRLREQTPTLVAVRGNNDVPTQSEQDTQGWAGLAREATVMLPGGALAITHGDQFNPASQRHALLRRHFPEAQAIVYGHSHRLVCDTQAYPWVLNPGAAGRVRTHGGPSCLILIIEQATWRVEIMRFAPQRPGFSAHPAEERPQRSG